MAKRKVKAVKRKHAASAKKGWRLYPLVKGNSNEFLLIVGGAFLILVSIMFIL